MPAQPKNDPADSMNLVKRQADSIMTVTSINTGTEKTIITAKGKMGEYGKVYVTYNLSLNADRTGGFVEGSGRGIVCLLYTSPSPRDRG